jgi:hypothetical protein
MARHMQAVNGLEPAAEEQLARMLPPYAQKAPYPQKAWEDICTPDGSRRSGYAWAIQPSGYTPGVRPRT